MSTVLITGAGTGIGRLTAIHLAHAGHTVFASMRDPQGRNNQVAQELRDSAATATGSLTVIELDVSSQESCDDAVHTVLAQAGHLDVVLHNAGHLVIGYVEAFTADEIAHLIDTNAIAVQRLNRAVLPHFRSRRTGTLMYTGSTIPITTPPFLGPYVVSKAAMDALAVVTSYEVSQFGIETVIVMPGAFTQGTNHFPKAGRANASAIQDDYQLLDPLVARNDEATEMLFTPGEDGDPVIVAEEIVRILDLPFGERPFRTVIDLTNSDVATVNDALYDARADFVRRMGYGDLLEVRTNPVVGV